MTIGFLLRENVINDPSGKDDNKNDDKFFNAYFRSCGRLNIVLVLM